MHGLPVVDRYLERQIDYLLYLTDRSDVRTAGKAVREGNRLTRATQAERSAFGFLERLRPLEVDISRALTSLPLPSPLNKVELEARAAWAEYPEGNMEPLDFFISERLGLRTSTEAEPSEALRRHVWDLLDSCFLSVPGYASGEWFALGEEEQTKLSKLVRRKLAKWVILARAVHDLEASEDAKADLDHEVPVAVMTLLRPEGAKIRRLREGRRLRGGRSQDFRNAVSWRIAEQVAIENPGTLPLLKNPEAGFEVWEDAHRDAGRELALFIEEAQLSPPQGVVLRIDLRHPDDKSRANKIAARVLGITIGTVKTHRSRYQAKIRAVASRAEER